MRIDASEKSLHDGIGPWQLDDALLEELARQKHKK
jgi:hypothetical protein